MGDRTAGVVLIGLRRAGKTTVGRQLAEGLGLPFVDLDDVIAERAGRPVADIIADTVREFAEAAERLAGQIKHD